MKTINLGYNAKNKKDPFAIYFVYTKDKKQLCIKGYAKDCMKYIQENVGPAIYHYTFWKQGKKRGKWAANKVPIYFTIEQIKTRKITRVTIYNKNYQEPDILYFRKFPRKWIPEYDAASEERHYKR